MEKLKKKIEEARVNFMSMLFRRNPNYRNFVLAIGFNDEVKDSGEIRTIISLKLNDGIKEFQVIAKGVESFGDALIGIVEIIEGKISFVSDLILSDVFCEEGRETKLHRAQCSHCLSLSTAKLSRVEAMAEVGEFIGTILFCKSCHYKLLIK
jgi:hypothetical protein